MPEMEAIEIRGEAEVGAVIHDELDAAAYASLQFPRVVEHFAGVDGFVAVLEECDASRRKFICGRKQGVDFRKTAGVENGVKARKENPFLC